MAGIGAERAAGMKIEGVLPPIRQQIEAGCDRGDEVAGIVVGRGEDVVVVGFVELGAREQEERAPFHALRVRFGPGSRHHRGAAWWLDRYRRDCGLCRQGRHRKKRFDDLGRCQRRPKSDGEPDRREKTPNR
jgi:hypothetical protein